MTQEAQGIAIAKACGLEVLTDSNPSDPDAWKRGHFTPRAAKHRRRNWPNSALVKVIPDYLNDYTAIILALRSFPVKIQGEVCKLMGCHIDYTVWIDTPPSVMCECLLKALNLWDDSK